jgi:ubiquinone biosynthesis accessory factor UbiK
MLDNSILKDLSDRLAALMPLAGEIRSEVRTKIEQTLKKGFAELDLLTREEFEQQAQSLQRAQARVDELEGLLKELEARLEQVESAGQESQGS